MSQDTETRVESVLAAAARELTTPGLTILAHPDVARIGERALLGDLASGREARLSRHEPLFSPPGSALRRPLDDSHVSRRPLCLAPAPAPAALRLVPSARTPLQVNGEEVTSARAISPAELAGGVTLLLGGRIALLLHALSPQSASAEDLGLLGASAAMNALRREIRRAAGLDTPVLLRGESGTGKELAAQAIHRESARRGKPFFAVNLAAVPPSLAAAELFGAAKGSFTGAAQPRRGFFREAEGGTLFLDEIGAAPAEIQDLLLRALENGEIQPVGAERPQKVDVRVIAATDADLEAAVADGHFRAPLLYRLGAWELHLPPLRERRDDIPRLLLAFLREELAAVGALARLERPAADATPWLAAPLVARLAAADWPGNVRQLKNIARQLALASHDLPRAQLPPRVERALLAAPPSLGPSREEPKRPVRKSYRSQTEVSDDELVTVLRRLRWRLKPAAEALGLSRTVLYSRIDRCPHIRKAADLSREEIATTLARTAGDLEAAAEALEVSAHGLQLRIRDLGLGPAT